MYNMVKRDVEKPFTDDEYQDGSKLARNGCYGVTLNVIEVIEGVE